MRMRIAFLLPCLMLWPIHVAARDHQGWTLVYANGAGVSGARAQDLNIPADDDGVAIFPTRRMCMEDLAENIVDNERSTPLIDRDQPSGWSKLAHCDLENAQHAQCLPYVKGKYANDALACP